jgi:ElaA protein
MLSWFCKSFSELTNEELYKILQLRNAVFIVEQKCYYQDCDGIDLKSFHLTGWKNDQLVAYTRLIPPGISHKNAASIGRVLTASSVRGENIGKELMRRSISSIQILFGNVTIKISAQLYLQRFYESFSFVKTGDVYLEDGIEHIPMQRDFFSAQ